MQDFSDTRIQVRRGTASEWATKNPVLGDGEPGYDITNKIFKIGDGITRWASLAAVSGGGGGGVEINDLTSIVTWANVPDANITESSVVQHSGALRITESQIVDLQNYITSGDNVSTLANDANYIISDNSIAAGSDKINNIINLSQSEYDSITPSTGVLYIIEDAPDPITSLPSSGNWDVAYSWVASNSGVVISSGDNISLLNNDLNYVESDTVGMTGASGVNNVVIISQADYDNIGSGNYDPNTIYFVP